MSLEIMRPKDLNLNFRGRMWVKLRYGLGLLWLIDAVLQLQPGMFTRAFYGNLPDNLMPSVLQTIHENAPDWIAWAIGLTQNSFIHFPVLTNILVVTVQLLLACALLLPVPIKYVKLAATGSIVWGLCIWVFGEALGGLGSWGSMTFYLGFPGSAFVYAFGGLVLLLSFNKWQTDFAYILVTRAIIAYLIVSGILQLLPINGQWDVVSQMSIFANSGNQTQPQVFSSPVMAYTAWVSNHAIANNILLSVLLFSSAYCILFWRVTAIARWIVYVWLFLSWWYGMDFGFLFSGTGTDPNTPPILFALLFSVAPSIKRPQRQHALINKPMMES